MPRESVKSKVIKHDLVTDLIKYSHASFTVEHLRCRRRIHTGFRLFWHTVTGNSLCQYSLHTRHSCLCNGRCLSRRQEYTRPYICGSALDLNDLVQHQLPRDFESKVHKRIFRLQLRIVENPMVIYEVHKATDFYS